MLGNRELTVDDYLAILRRRKWVILIPAVLGPLVALGIALKIPSRYSSETLVLVEQQKVPDSYVKPVVTEDLNARLATMQEQILSRTRLQPTIERFDLYRELKGREPMEELVDRMRKDISVTPVKSVAAGRQGDVPGFYIGFTADDPRVAQQVCAEITSMFIEENLRQREQSSQGTTKFLQTQLEEAQRQLDEQDAKLAQFKRRHMGSLPDDTQTNLNLLASLNTELAAATQSLHRAQQDKTYTESLLAQQVAARDALTGGSDPHPERLQEQLASMENELLALESRYTSDHPDVIKLKTELEQLRLKARERARTGSVEAPQIIEAAPLIESPQIQQLRSRVHAYDRAAEIYSLEQERLKGQIKLYQTRIQLSPLVEQEHKQLTRDYQTALDFYNDLLKKRNQSQMATDLERRQQGEQFRVMDPANLPEKPSYPNRPLFALAGFGGGLALGLALALALEMRDKSLRTELDVEFYLGLPTLAVVPSVGGSGNGRQRWRGWIRRRSEPAERTLEV